MKINTPYWIPVHTPNKLTTFIDLISCHILCTVMTARGANYNEARI